MGERWGRIEGWNGRNRREMRDKGVRNVKGMNGKEWRVEFSCCNFNSFAYQIFEALIWFRGTKSLDFSSFADKIFEALIWFRATKSLEFCSFGFF